jgi:hypothetical protein
VAGPRGISAQPPAQNTRAHAEVGRREEEEEEERRCAGTGAEGRVKDAAVHNLGQVDGALRLDLDDVGIDGRHQPFGHTTREGLDGDVVERRFRVGCGAVPVGRIRFHVFSLFFLVAFHLLFLLLIFEIVGVNHLSL